MNSKVSMESSVMVSLTYTSFDILGRVGQETLMDDNLAEDDIEIELAPIAVQLAYVQQVR